MNSSENVDFLVRTEGSCFTAIFSIAKHTKLCPWCASEATKTEVNIFNFSCSH